MVCGEVLIIGDRDCSLQRRHQKVIEECPAPNLPPAVREELHRQARELLASVKYRMAGTVEFLYDAEARRFYFLEVNTRLQVEHGVTECVYGVDIVEWMLRLAAGSLPPLSRLASRPSGHAVEARVYAEDPNHAFRPTPGDVSHAAFPSREGLRVDTWLRSGASVSPYFDPMLAKVICHEGNARGGPRRTVPGTARKQASMASRPTWATSLVHWKSRRFGRAG